MTYLHCIALERKINDPSFLNWVLVRPGSVLKTLFCQNQAEKKEKPADCNKKKHHLKGVLVVLCIVECRRIVETIW